MSRVAALLADLAAGGVPYLALGSIASIRTGERPTNAALAAGGSRAYLNGGVVPSGYVEDANTDADTIAIPSRGSVGVVGYSSVPFWCGPLCYRVASSTPGVLTRFLYFALKTQEPRIVGLQQTGSIPALNKKELVTVRVPVPPLEVQREMVRILDTFIRLEAELEAELEARRRQFEHYRNLHLTFDADTPRVPLGEIVEVRSGWGFPNAQQGATAGDYPFYKVSDMNLLGNETVMTRANNYVSLEVARSLGVRPAPAGSIIFPKIGAAVATNKKRILSGPSAYDNNVMALIPRERVASRYLYHWMQTLNISKLANHSGAVPSIRKSEVEQTVMPLPDMDAQIRIANLLDKFDFLVNDLSIGLPAELLARRKQYAHYRDQLFAFREAGA